MQQCYDDLSTLNDEPVSVKQFDKIIESTITAIETSIMSIFIELSSIYEDFSRILQGPFRNEKDDILKGFRKIQVFENSISRRLTPVLEGLSNSQHDQ